MNKKSLHITNITYQDFDERAFYYITYPGVVPFLYAINIYGTILSMKQNRERIRKFDYDSQGYVRIALRSVINDNILKNKNYLVSRLVAWEFVGKPEKIDGFEVNHADGDHSNNYYKNLEWTTPHENSIHKVLLGLSAQSEKHGWNSHKEIVVKDIIEMIKMNLDAPTISKIILNKYPDLYSKETKYDYDRLRGLVSKIKNGYSWNNISNIVQSSTTIENIPYEKHIGEEVSRVGLQPTKVAIRKGGHIIIL